MKYDCVIIGGGPAGLVTAMTAKKSYPDKSIAVIKKEEVGMVPCGIPYIFNTLKSIDENVLLLKPFEDLGIEFIVDEVTDVDLKSKVVKTANGREISYEKLVFATGSKPVIPKIDGVDKEGVFVVSKYADELERLYNATKKSEKIVIVGGGFIGLEVGDQLAKSGKKVTIVEMMDQLLPVAFDKEFAEVAKSELEKLGVKIYLNNTVKRILGDSSVEGVELADGTKIDADLVILSVGYRPNVELAEKAGLKIGESGAIWVDEYMRTSVNDVFAVGDCAEHRDFFTSKPIRLLLASVACADGKVAGANLFKLRVTKANKGTLSVFSTYVGNLAFGAAGLTETMAKREGFDVVVGVCDTVNRHPAKIPDAVPVKVKLLFCADTGKILGGQIYGGKEVGEMINIVSLAIQNGMTASDLSTAQVGTHPLLTPAPVMYPIIIAAENALIKMKK